MDTTSNAKKQRLSMSSSPSRERHTRISYSPPSPACSLSSESMDVVITASGPCSPTSPSTTGLLNQNDSDYNFCTPKKSLADSGVLERIRRKRSTPRGACEMHALRWEQGGEQETCKIIKNRFLITAQVCQIPPIIAANTPASYRHLVNFAVPSLTCTDVVTDEDLICKVINQPCDKVQRAYYEIKVAGDIARCSIFGHKLIRDVHDVVPIDKQHSYLLIPMPKGKDGKKAVYEDLHTYIRNKRRLCEEEARMLFHQIAETVQLCHRKGVILRDLKLKRFYFIDEARTQIQYESLEGSMILDNAMDDTLSDKIGCPLYTAPELLCPNPTYQGKPADMWSLGVILYTMLVGQYPFYETANCNLITIIRHCQVQIPVFVSKQLRWLILILLSKNYDERLTAEEVFLTPWLKSQQPNGNVFLHVGTNLDDLEMEDDETDVSEQAPSSAKTEQQKNFEEDCQGNVNSDISASHFIEDCQDSDDCDYNNTVEPLNYSRHTLHTHTVAAANRAIHLSDDVDTR
ncbi:tribbles isoform X2 [Anastrepha ludens]|uniref:tribbles isoform X2 n=1 Tax=Anastrepha ludens TaxID=28586 RepID=UPI0023B189C4|nr:tribbles isoform X2 [Anastrepha ludens]